MSLAIDPMISNIFFTLSLLPHLNKTSTGQIYAGVREDLPCVSVLVPLFKENREDIEITLASLRGQTFPKSKLEAILIVEPEDSQTSMLAEAGAQQLEAVGIRSKVVYSKGNPKMKPHALNVALRNIENEFICVYDASDSIEEDQIEQALSLMLEGNYDVVQAQVCRQGSTVLSRLLWLDTSLWFRKYVPMIAGLTGGFPLSGEGLFVKKSVLEEVGYFPEMLTEDACLGLLLTERGKRFALLESTVVEKAPKNIQAHFWQKLRWYRGYLTCLGVLIRSKMSTKKKLSFSLLFSTPIVGALAFVSWVLFIGYWGTHFLVPELDILVPWMSHPIYLHAIYFWSLSLTLLGPLTGIWSYLSVAPRQERCKLVPLVFLVPLYWVFVSTCAISAFFQSANHWYKTER
jgi:cellulose synthase/poly-beta-1,6-N-acetylglucosamine synthase-like glycosyltransferase